MNECGVCLVLSSVSSVGTGRREETERRRGLMYGESERREAGKTASSSPSRQGSKVMQGTRATCELAGTAGTCFCGAMFVV